MDLFSCLLLCLLIPSLSFKQTPDFILSSQETFNLDVFSQTRFSDYPEYSTDSPCLQNLRFSERNFTLPLNYSGTQSRMRSWLYYHSQKQVVILFEDNSLVLFETSLRNELIEKASWKAPGSRGEFSQMLMVDDDNFVLIFFLSDNNLSFMFFKKDSLTLLNDLYLPSHLQRPKAAISSSNVLIYSNRSVSLYLIFPLKPGFIIKPRTNLENDIDLGQKIVEIVPKPCVFNFLDSCSYNPKFFITLETKFNRYTLGANNTLIRDFPDFNVTNLQKVDYSIDKSLYFVVCDGKFKVYSDRSGKIKTLGEAIYEFPKTTRNDEIEIYYGPNFLVIANYSNDSMANSSDENDQKSWDFFFFKKITDKKDNHLYKLFFHSRQKYSWFIFNEFFGLVFSNGQTLHQMRINPNFFLSFQANTPTDTYCSAVLNYSFNQKNYSKSFLIVPLQTSSLRVLKSSISAKRQLENHIRFAISPGLPFVVGPFIQILAANESVDEFELKVKHNKTGIFSLSTDNLLFDRFAGFYLVFNKSNQTLETRFKLASFQENRYQLIECEFALKTMDLMDQEFSCLGKADDLSAALAEGKIIKIGVFHDEVSAMVVEIDGRKYLKVEENKLELADFQSWEIVNDEKNINYSRAIIVESSKTNFSFILFPRASVLPRIIGINQELAKFNGEKKPNFHKIKMFDQNFKGKYENMAFVGLEFISISGKIYGKFWFFTIKTKAQDSNETQGSFPFEILQNFTLNYELSYNQADLDFYFSSSKNLLVAINSLSILIEFSYNQTAFNLEFFTFRRILPLPIHYVLKKANDHDASISKNDFYYIKAHHQGKAEILVFDLLAFTPNSLVWTFQDLDINCPEASITTSDFKNTGRKDVLLIRECNKSLSFRYFDNKVIFKLKDLTRSTSDASISRFLSEDSNITNITDSLSNDPFHIQLIVQLPFNYTLAYKYPYRSFTYIVSATIDLTPINTFESGDQLCLNNHEIGHVFLTQILNTSSYEISKPFKFHDFAHSPDFFISEQKLTFNYFAFKSRNNYFFAISDHNALNFTLEKRHAEISNPFKVPKPFKVKFLTDSFLIFSKNKNEFGLLSLSDGGLFSLSSLTKNRYYASTIVPENSKIYMLLREKSVFKIRTYDPFSSPNEFFDFLIELPQDCAFMRLNSKNLQKSDNVIFLFFKKDSQQYTLATFFHLDGQKSLIYDFQSLPWFNSEVEVTAFTVNVGEFNAENETLIEIYCNTRKSGIYEFSLRISLTNDREFPYKILDLSHTRIYNHFPGCIYKSEIEFVNIENLLIIARICQNLEKEAVVFYRRNKAEETPFHLNITGSSPFFFRDSIKQIMLKDSPPKLIVLLQSTIFTFNLSLNGACFQSYGSGQEKVSYGINAMNFFHSSVLLVNGTASMQPDPSSQIAFLALIILSAVVFFVVIALVVYCLCQRRIFLSMTPQKLERGSGSTKLDKKVSLLFDE